MTKIGPTGDYPHGKLNDDDEGGLMTGVTHLDSGEVIINFGKPVAWFGMPKEIAIDFAKLVLKHAGAKTISIEF